MYAIDYQPRITLCCLIITIKVESLVKKRKKPETFLVHTAHASLPTLGAADGYLRIDLSKVIK